MKKTTGGPLGLDGYAGEMRPRRKAVKKGRLVSAGKEKNRGQMKASMLTTSTMNKKLKMANDHPGCNPKTRQGKLWHTKKEARFAHKESRVKATKISAVSPEVCFLKKKIAPYNFRAPFFIE